MHDRIGPKEIVPKAPALALRCAVLVATAIGCLLTIGAVLTNQLSWLPVVVALTVVAYWLVYRNLASDPATARIAAFGCAAVWAWLVVLNAAAQDIALVVIEGICVGCLLYAAVQLSRTSSAGDDKRWR
jgi:hypothetical protein